MAEKKMDQTTEKLEYIKLIWSKHEDFLLCPCVDLKEAIEKILKNKNREGSNEQYYTSRI